MFKITAFIGAVTAAALGVSLMATPASASGVEILSLNPLGAFLENDAYFDPAPAQGALRLPHQFRPTFYLGFTVPDNYNGREPLVLTLLVETRDTDCDLALATNKLFRMRDGEPRDFGNASGGFTPQDASTCSPICSFPYSNTIVFPAPAVARSTSEVTFEIDGGPLGEFPDILRPGDGVVFSIFRETSSTTQELDTCRSELGVGGISIHYDTN